MLQCCEVSVQWSVGALLTDVPGRTEGVRVRGGGVALAALRQTAALDTLGAGRAGAVRVIGGRVAVTAGGEGGLAGAVLQCQACLSGLNPAVL